MPSGHVIKVPETLADSPAMRLRVRVDGSGTYTIILAVNPRDHSDRPGPGDSGAPDAPGEAAGSLLDTSDAAASAAFAAAAGIDPATPQPIGPGPVASLARSWRIIGLGDVLNAVHCSEADELCIEKFAPNLCCPTLSQHLLTVLCMNPVVGVQPGTDLQCLRACSVTRGVLPGSYTLVLVQGARQCDGAPSGIHTPASCPTLQPSCCSPAPIHIHHELVPAHARLYEG